MERYNLVAPCGDHCGGCGQFNGLISGTAEQMKEFADLYGFEFRSKGQFDLKQFLKGLDWFIQNAKCPGCLAGGGPAWCQVKKCCSGRELRICFECEDFPCAKIEEVADPDTMDRYKRFIEVGFEEWAKEQTTKIKEGYEIHLQKEAFLRPSS
jgi:hypothetical protein